MEGTKIPIRQAECVQMKEKLDWEICLKVSSNAYFYIRKVNCINISSKKIYAIANFNRKICYFS